MIRQAFVVGEGTSGGYGEALDDRLKLATDDPGRDIVLPIVETLPGSRDDKGKLKGKVRIADFVAVHLDGVVEVEIVDPKDPKKTIKVDYLMGTIITRRAETSWGGGSVGVVELVQ
jgi:hypothetical protein